MKNQLKLREVNPEDLQPGFDEIIGDYLPVKIRLLLPETKLPCDIYFPATDGSRRVLTMDKLVSQGQLCTQDILDYLAGEDIAEAYIRKDQESNFYNYFNGNVQRIIHSPNIPSEKKTQLLYDNAEAIVQKVFKERPTRSNISMGRQLVKSFATHISLDNVSVEALFSLFSKDYYTFTHSVQVALLGMSFCKFLGWSVDEVADFGLGGLFHDIGKNAIDESILNKPSPLEKDEFEMIKKHTLLGYQQLRSAQFITKDQLTVVLHHHEAMDGSGYLGLKDYQIHKYARVARIADCYDALTTKRPYKEALSPSKALETLGGEMRETFDEPLLRAFFRFLGMEEGTREAPRGERISIVLGSQLIVQSEDGAVRLKMMLVGMEAEEYLILRIPGPARFLRHLGEGRWIVARYVHSGTVFGFRSTVIGHILHPVQLLFLSYPKAVENINLRKDPRVDCFLPAEANIHGSLYPCVLMDLSLGGCKLILKQSTNGSLPSTRLDESISFRSQLLGEKKAGSFCGRVRDIKVDDGKTVLGVQFVDLDEETLGNLKRCIKNVLTLVK